MSTLNIYQVSIKNKVTFKTTIVHMINQMMILIK